MSASGSTSRRVWQLAWPTIISNLLFATVGFMHIKIVAALGNDAVAAVTSGHRIFFLLQAVLMGVSVATTAMVARSWGAERIAEAELVTWTSMALGMCLAALLSLPMLFFPAAVAGVFGLNAEATRLAASFIFWLSVFNIFAAINMILSTALRATGDVITPLWFLLLSSTFNVTFAYLLAYGIGGLPAWGVAGVGFGGGFAGALVSCLFVLLWWRGKFSLQALKRLQLDRPTLRQLMTLGAPSMLEQGVVQLAFLCFFAIVAQYGTAAYAAYGIGISLVSFSIVVGFGFSIAAATLVGQQLGAGKPEQAVAAGWRGMRMAIVAMSLLSIVLAFNAKTLAAFMIPNEETQRLTVIFIYLIAAVQPIMAVEITLAGALRGAGDTRFPLIATLCGIVLGRLLPALLILVLGLPVTWIFAVMLLDYCTKATLLLWRYQSGNWLQLRVLPTPASDS
ncbi:MATE family efflux transporter [Pseudohalioglobus sediminis]|uniref:Multidrug-efflux transporter n=1 Tax=Pseudohalioglobus sediminis TaxID=2606449 RepID=A0A5B0X7K5_9GAMM|nr:MATE family efflux transporter [Pseudohalioglobus sediminis]KAA1194578.1 MATE family efflux transporter [Pseudohalioglobus sediminis]